ncbi:protein kinase [Streptomyces stramineus]
MLLRGEDEHVVVLSLDHVITDGHSAIALYNALWQTYAELADGTYEPPADGGSAAARPATDLLPQVGEEEVAQYLARRVERTRRSPVSALPYGATGTPEAARARIEVQRVLLEPEETTRLLRFAKAAEVSVHGLIGAAMLIAVRRGLGGGDEARALGCMSPVDLRTRVTPPLGREVMVPAVATFLDVLEVAADADPVALGRLVTANLHTAIERREFVHETRILPHVAGNPALLATSVIVTNMGARPGPPAPRGLELTDMRLVPARENYYPQAGRGPLLACVVSFDGRLGIDIPYSTECFGDEQVRAVRDSVRTTLLTLADRTEPRRGGAGLTGRRAPAVPTGAGRGSGPPPAPPARRFPPVTLPPHPPRTPSTRITRLSSGAARSESIERDE